MLIPNATGARLVTCTVEVAKRPEIVSHTLTEQYIIAYEVTERGQFVPRTLTGPIIGWGELRASVAGCFVYGIGLLSGGPIQTATQSYRDLDAFIEDTRAQVLKAVRSVREEKGWYRGADTREADRLRR